MEAQHLRRLLDDHQFFHDSVQLERFIVAGHGWTPWSAYKQCLRELRSRFEALKTDYRQIKGLDIERREMEHNLKGNMNHFPREKAKLAVELKLLEIEGAQAVAQDRAREFAFFANQAHAISESLGEITPDRRAELDLEAWCVRLKSDAAAELCATGQVSLKTMCAIRLLPPGPRGELIGALRIPEERERLISWWQTFEPEIPKAVPVIAPEDVEQLITCQSESLQLS